MQFNDIEQKLINLALCHGAHDGEAANAATMLFKQLRKRNVTAQQFNSNTTTGPSIFGSAASDAFYRQAYDNEKQTNVGLRHRIATLTADAERMQRHCDNLVAQVHAARNAPKPPKVANPKGTYYGGILLTDIERAMFIRIAAYFDPNGTTYGVTRVCKNNRENGSIQGLIKKGLVVKTGIRVKRLALTEAGLAHFRQYHRDS